MKNELVTKLDSWTRDYRKIWFRKHIVYQLYNNGEGIRKMGHFCGYEQEWVTGRKTIVFSSVKVSIHHTRPNVHTALANNFTKDICSYSASFHLLAVMQDVVCVKFEVLPSVTTKITLFSHVAPCSLVAT